MGRYVQSPYANLDALVEASSQHQAADDRRGELRDRPVSDGGIGYSLEKDHPSELFAKSGVLSIGPGDLLEALIAAAAADRRQVRRELVETLEALIEARRRNGG